MSKLIFERLIAAAGDRGIEISNPTRARYIKRISDADAELMSTADASAVIASRHVRLIKIKNGDELYYGVFGITEPEDDLPGLKRVDTTPGLFAIAILEGRVHPPLVVSGSIIRDAIEDQHGGIENYEGFELSAIEPLFPKLHIYNATKELISSTQNEYRTLGILISNSYHDGPIEISSDTLKILSDTFISGSEYLPFKNLVQGILSISWEGLFLEIYRCLEQLYADPRVSELVNY